MLDELEEGVRRDGADGLGCAGSTGPNRREGLRDSSNASSCSLFARAFSTATASGCNVCDSRSGRDFLVAFDQSRALSVVMNETNETTQPEDRTNDEGTVLLLTMIDAARALSIGRTTMYELVAAGEIGVVHIGRSVRIPADALHAFVERRRAD